MWALEDCVTFVTEKGLVLPYITSLYENILARNTLFNEEILDEYVSSHLIQINAFTIM